MKHFNLKPLVAIFFVLALFPLFSSPCPAKEPKKVAVLPFNMNTDKDLSFLQNGIIDMIGSRLAWKGEVVVIENEKVRKTLAQYPGPVSRERAVIIGEALEADYIVIGSMTVLGESVSIDASIIDVRKDEESVTAYNQSESLDDIIPAIDQFARDINAKVMGRYRQPVYASAFGDDAEAGGYMSEYIEEISHTQSFDRQFRGIDVGDVDGDGKNELVLIDSDTVYIYKWVKNTFALFSSYKTGQNSNCIYVSLGDMDGNGRDEIYVSNVYAYVSSSSQGLSSPAEGLSSFVLEWQNDRLVPILDRQDWLFRVEDIPGKGLSLLGQKLDFQGNFGYRVYFLQREEDRFKNPEFLILPSKANIFNFAMGDITNDGKLDTLVFNSFTDYLYLYDHRLDEIWKSEEYYGGLEIYIENQNEEWDFISPPLLITDIDRNGGKEIIICQNSSTTRRLLKRLRMYNAGTINVLSWDRHDLVSVWKSEKLPPLSGYRIADADNDGKPELVAISVVKPRELMDTIGRNAYSSELYIYDLE